MNDIIVKTAASQIGVKEISGSEHNDAIIDYSREIGIKWINDDETPWCAVFVNWVLKKSGYIYSPSALARSFDNYGEATLSPESGDIVVFWRESLSSGKGHVGIFLGNSTDGKIFVLGGNQSNAVTISKYSTSNVVSYRRVGSQDSLEIPEPVLKIGDRGAEVTKLQRILKHFNYKLIPDGDFGKNTKKAVSDFQLDNHLTPSGVYDRFTQETLFSILNK